MMQVSALVAMAVAMGVYQGVNPSMGWLYATARGLENRSVKSLIDGGVKFAWGHYLGMNVVLLPMAWLLALTRLHPMLLMPWIGATLMVYGLLKLRSPGHPRLLNRVSPLRVSRWSFVMALTHCGSPLMMISPLLGLVMVSQAGAPAATNLATTLQGYTLLALGISAAMALPQLLISLAIAMAVYSRLGLKALTRYWLNFDLGWSIIFILMGAMAVGM
ncbi:hypothetical protein [Acidihalobacter ferrooxydans]|uniref:Urease accessory protein UreH-like transmembrane domain-containing protein n=1 Tax=Acidihalobacter ferrooxydans TaxID=1765967 RepID=A0A1P8UGY4_9GAMM|nr:hypothetical protein [Acidihalobacter ferrooxydans]APZ43095.1 hypothetical protein BW247_08330 [Acidihalobacter ferrooxydans]